MKLFPEKRVVITGAGSGLGRALAVEFAKKEWKVLVSDVNMDGAEETVKQVNDAGGQGFAIPCDVTQWEQVEKLADSAVSKWGGVDIIVNNAGVLNVGPMEKIRLEDWRWIIDINLMGVIHGCKAFIPVFKKQGSGHIVNIASAAGFSALAEMGPYNVTADLFGRAFGLLKKRVHPVVRLFFRISCLIHQIGFKKRRTHHRYADIFACQFRPKGFRQGNHAGFGDIVWPHFRQSGKTGSRCDVYDMSLSLFLKHRNKRFASMDNAHKIDVDNPAPVFQPDFFHRADIQHAGIIDDDINAPPY